MNATDNHRRRLLRSTIDGFGQGTRLSAQMETQVKVMNVGEDSFRKFANASMGNVGEYRIAQFAEQGGTRSRSTI